MSAELTALTLAALLLSVQFVFFSVHANRELGSGYTMSPRDRPPNNSMTDRTARLGRAFENHVQWLVLFAIAIAIIELSGQNSAFTGFCAWVYLIARIAYVPAYAMGLKPWRSAIWAVGFLATVLILLAALF